MKVLDIHRSAVLGLLLLAGLPAAGASAEAPVPAAAPTPGITGTGAVDTTAAGTADTAAGISAAAAEAPPAAAPTAAAAANPPSTAPTVAESAESAEAAGVRAARPVPEWRTGVIMGYNLGQNGQPWPSVLKNPAANNNRGGFYVSQARAQVGMQLDSSFRVQAAGNAITVEFYEIFLEKMWGDYRFKAGKFRGAGLKSGSGTDEFELIATRRPFYTQLWGYYKRTLAFRDFGIQAEKAFFSGRMNNRLFLHNASGANLYLDEPSYPSGPPTQVLGLDYAWDWYVGPYTTVGGHVGALAHRAWEEFTGNHDFWQAQYWFKSNPLVDASFYHRMAFPRFRMENEALIMQNRTLVKPDGSSSLTWGFSTLSRFDHFLRWSPFAAYEFTDHTDGYYADDALHVLKLGTVFRPSPGRYAGLGITGEYARALEENGRNLVGNDILYAELKMVF